MPRAEQLAVLHDYARHPSLTPTQHYLPFLVKVNDVLEASLGSPPPLATVAQLAVAHIADWCAIDVLNPDGTIRRLAIAHKDPQKAQLAQELERLYPMNLDAPRGLPYVLRTGRSKLYPEVADRALQSIARDPRHLAMLRELGLTSAMIVPLIARGHALGGIRLAIAESGRRYGPTDLAFAEDFARRVALMLDNARLYQEACQAAEAAQVANASKDQFLAVLSHELRTPLTPVLTAVTALEEQPQLPADIRSTAQMIRRNVEIQAHLIDDLLDLTRITRGKLELNLSTVDAHEILRQAIQICQKNIRDKGLFLWLELAAQHTHVRA
ncbi:MAG: histidine kinase dimerization/phospho-acceptor domain-containing protein, partial [Bacillota bacterium]